MLKRINIWYLSSFIISIVVVIPIITVFSSFFEDTSQYFEILKKTFFIEYIINSLILLIGVLFLTFILGVGSAYIVSFYKFPGSNFFKWALILSFAVPPYIYAYSLFAFFENYGTAFTILKHLLGEGNYNKHIPKLDDNEELQSFSNLLEKVCIKTVEKGFMTKDLALLVGSNQSWLNTHDFIDKIDSNLQSEMS